IVIVADWRGLPLMSSEASEQILRNLAHNNPRVKRSAALASSTSAAAMLQFIRVVRDSGHPNRKVFTSASELEQWVGEVLTPPEHTRLRQFLGELSRAPALDFGPLKL